MVFVLQLVASVVDEQLQKRLGMCRYTDNNVSLLFFTFP